MKKSQTKRVHTVCFSLCDITFPSTTEVAFMNYFRVIDFRWIEFYTLLRLIYEDIAFISEYIRIILLKVNVLF